MKWRNGKLDMRLTCEAGRAGHRPVAQTVLASLRNSLGGRRPALPGARVCAFLHPVLRGSALCLAVSVLLLSGCVSQQASESASGSSVDVSAASTSESATVNEVDASEMDFEYSKRDLDASYDDDAATHITLAGTSASVEGDGAVADGTTVTISAEGTYVVSGSLSDGQVVVEAPDDAKVQVVLADASIHNEEGPAMYVKQADKVFITLADGTTNTLTDGANYVLEEGSDEPYATLFSKEDLTLNGTGALTVTSAYRHAVCSKDDLVITGGTYTVDAVEDALRGRDCVKICDGSFTISAGGDGIKSNNDEDATRGFVSIDGGTFAIEVGDDAVHAETVMVINDGTVDVASCYEGYEGEKVYINGGTTHIVASDDALNAASSQAEVNSDESRMFNNGMPETGMAEGGMGMGDENCLIQINGGYTVLDAGGDGVDSNGSVEVTGGVLLVSGPTDGGNGAFDYDLTATVSGGTVLMVGSVGMAQNFTSGTQPFSFATVNGGAGQSVAVVDGDGNVVASFMSAKQFGMVVASSPAFAEGGTYQLVIGGEVTGANADGYTDAGTVRGGTVVDITASTTAAGGMGGLGMEGGGMPAGQPGDIQRGSRGDSGGMGGMGGMGNISPL